MADAKNTSKIDAAAEKAFEEAAAKKTASAAKVAEAVEADAPKAEVSAKAVKKAVAVPAKKKAPAARKTAAKPAAKKIAAKKTAVKKAPAKKQVAKKTPAKAAAKTAASTNPVSKLKDTIMATAEKNDFTADLTSKAKELAADAQTRVKGAYGKASELASEAGEFNKANVEAVVESGKIFFAGAQEIVKSDVETGKAVIETVTADAKKVASVKSPTDLFELQGEITRRNFDAAVAFGSKRTEALVKLYNDAFAPISNRVSVATERAQKAA
ncbi:phasin family protein [Qipengyuania sp. S6317L1]|uniref:phasin family protein n=1 Tax=Qipengyuania sp. S6317L1 TaxID=2926410 RepID=UPI001FF62DDE|nr:phasin family protein [Qipengyuania sp. S6317L1]MCK0098620.1 phasin family protein [Qipengyuania sp. S6317L1]